ncbi:hypothetical protein KGF57_003911 [Candida theae]|uniref:Major facilitator superfamily (MFS) profile domain-containing protein n=1 Tax=Candida theae TaxID=1198502 RepID=A0AAD5FXS0_9ASCO|nr:uncharacterized protein KGF57_003911 [Candida theae]KAI5954885.1 hypothetical protein KGF57_003911 [Candida theae]
MSLEASSQYSELNNEANSSNHVPHSHNHPTLQKVEFEGEILTIDTNNWRHSKLLQTQIISSYLVFILFGLNEQTVGTLIPKLQEHYHLSDLHVSFIFFSSVLGYLTMALVNNKTHDQLGIRGVAVLGASAMCLGNLCGSFRPPFLIFLICYFSNGVGLGALDASLNAWMGNLVDSNQLLGILHGCYGIGSLISPSLITYLLEKSDNPWQWNSYYLLVASFGATVLILVGYTFRFETPKKYKYMAQLRHQKSKQRRPHDDNDVNEFELNDMNKTNFDVEEDAEAEEEEEHSATFMQAVKSPLVWGFAGILFIYVGGEVAFGAWLVTYLLRIKDWTYKASSHMATTFWLGLTVGRCTLGFVTAHYFSNELTANLAYIVGSLLGYVFFWFLSFTQQVVFLFIIVFVTGAMVGPIFPTTIVASVNILPAKYQTVGIGFICAFGGGGAAGIPFLVGLLADSSEGGLKAYPVMVIIIFAILLVSWMVIIKKHARGYKRNTI